MASKTQTPTEDTQPGTVGYDESQFEWDNVHEEAPDQLVFDTLGDKYVGEYSGHDLIYPTPDDPSKWFIQLRFRDMDGTKVTNAGYELRTAYVNVTVDDAGMVVAHEDKIPTGSITRTELVKLVDVDQASPMKSYRVDIARKPVDAGNKKK